jgi:two-component system, cell cycle response regulator
MSESLPVVLVADDTLHNLQYLGTVIEECGYEPILANSGTQVLEFVKSVKPDIILLDVIMPDLDGYEVCKKLKTDPEISEIPIIFITAKKNEEDIVAGFDAGGVDYIPKPFNSKELRARLKTHIELKLSRDKLHEYVKKVEKMMNELDYLSRVDYLTNLFNRRSFYEYAKLEVARFKRHQKSFSIVLADIDRFKSINDTYGHDCGDYVLKCIAQIAKSTMREQDIVTRWGGEEFLFMLPETDIAGAKTMVERLRRNIKDYPFTYGSKNNKMTITLTFGIDLFDGTKDMEETIRNADAALYKGKEKGRNCRVVFGE